MVNGSHSSTSDVNRHLPDGVAPTLRGNGNNGPPPPIPARPTNWPPTAPHMNYMNNYMYSPYHANTFGHRYNIGSYGTLNRFQDQNRSDFSQMAENNSRSAFQSIESIVNAFSSVSMMLESTYQAVYSSFHAVIGVADNFSRLRNHLVTVFSSLSLFRFLYYLYQRILQLLGLRQTETVSDAWSQAANTAKTEVLERLKTECNTTTWPILMYMGIILGAPWLIWKLLARFSPNNDASGWMTGVDDHFTGRVLYDFSAANQQEVSATAGQIVRIAPQESQPMVREWLLVSGDGETSGLVPATYIRILGQCRGSRHVETSQAKYGHGDTTGNGAEGGGDYRGGVGHTSAASRSGGGIGGGGGSGETSAGSWSDGGTGGKIGDGGGSGDISAGSRSGGGTGGKIGGGGGNGDTSSGSNGGKGDKITSNYDTSAESHSNGGKDNKIGSNCNTNMGEGAEVQRGNGSGDSTNISDGIVDGGDR